MEKKIALMSEQKDPAIKLFGKTIPVAEPPPIYGGGGGDGSLEASYSSTTTALVEEIMNMNSNNNNSCSNMDRDEGNSNKDGEEDDQDRSDDNHKETKEETQPEASSEDQRNSDAASGVSDNPKTSSAEENSGTAKAEEEQSEGSNSQDKTTLKKPDKILPCPRCNSMDTKFCYYNNYNVNQPRHFCKNCQRYWTAGGTMRNVPVGAGRRKNKNSSAASAAAVHYRHVSEPALTPKPNGTVLSFGSDAPLCESMASVLCLADRTMRNGFHKPEDLTIPVGGEVSPLTSPPAEDEPPREQQALPSFAPPIPCFPTGAPWQYQWTPPAAAAFGPPGFPMPFYPAAAAYWGWNVPWLPAQPPNSGGGGPGSGPNSPTLGKHSRDENNAARPSSWEGPPPKPREGGSERSLWIPKTLRIDDPGEAARSSIWATLGIKNDKPDSISGTGLFKSFQPKNDQRNPMQETSTKVLQANPAALSRSVSFREGS